jgi:hypothetical protein
VDQLFPADAVPAHIAITPTKHATTLSFGNHRSDIFESLSVEDEDIGTPSQWEQRESPAITQKREVDR